VGVIDRLAARAQKRVGDLPYVDEDDRWLAIISWLVAWGFAILMFVTIIYLVGGALGWWDAEFPGRQCDPLTGDCQGP
jgi:hypothetical protein